MRNDLIRTVGRLPTYCDLRLQHALPGAATLVLLLGMAGKSFAQSDIPPPPRGDAEAIEIPIWEEDETELRSSFPTGADELSIVEPADDGDLVLDRLEALVDDLPDTEGDPAAGDPDDATASVTPQRSAPDLLTTDDPAIDEPVVALESPTQGPVFRIGLVPRGDPSDAIERLAPLKVSLSQALDRPVDILAMESFSALIDAQALRRVDLAFYSASAFATADIMCGCVEPLVAPAALDGSVAIYGVVVVRAGSGVVSVDDLQGRSVAAASGDSIGGRRYQLVSLIEEGIDPARHFSEVIDAGSSVNAVLDVRDGIVDAAFAWTSLNGDRADGYSRGTFTHLVQRNAIAMEDFAIVWQSRPLAHGPAAVQSGLDEGDKAILAAFLGGLSESDPATYDLLDPFYGGGFRPVESSEYRGALLLAKIDTRQAVKPAVMSTPRARPMTPVQILGAPEAPEPGEIADSVDASVEEHRGENKPIKGILEQF